MLHFLIAYLYVTILCSYIQVTIILYRLAQKSRLPVTASGITFGYNGLREHHSTYNAAFAAQAVHMRFHRSACYIPDGILWCNACCHPAIV